MLQPAATSGRLLGRVHVRPGEAGIASVRSWSGRSTPATPPLRCFRVGSLLRARFREVVGPIVHEPTPTLEQVRSGIGGLDPVLHHMRQRRLDDLARMVRLLGRPVPERRAEAVGPPPCSGNSSICNRLESAARACSQCSTLNANRTAPHLDHRLRTCGPIRTVGCTRGGVASYPLSPAATLVWSAHVCFRVMPSITVPHSNQVTEYSVTGLDAGRAVLKASRILRPGSVNSPRSQLARTPSPFANGRSNQSGNASTSRDIDSPSIRDRMSNRLRPSRARAK